MNLNGQFFYVKAKESVGPLTIDELLEQNISVKTYIWTKGMENWQMIESLPVILSKFNEKKIQPPLFDDSKIGIKSSLGKRIKIQNILIFFGFGLLFLILGLVGGYLLKDEILNNLEKKKLINNRVKDIDGNIYGVTKIGEQYWTTSNLNVSHFRNGDEVPYVTSAKAWEEASKSRKPACSCYENVEFNCQKYGRLYNYYAVIDKRGLTPKGWRIPSDKDWTTLEGYLGTEGGSILKSNIEFNGTDEVSFNALLGGYRDYYGKFYDIKKTAFFITSTWTRDNTVWGRFLRNDQSKVYRQSNSKEYGASVRCLKE
jgi:uncharacterized protein (TIGR02145 family)